MELDEFWNNSCGNLEKCGVCNIITTVSFVQWEPMRMSSKESENKGRRLLQGELILIWDHVIPQIASLTVQSSSTATYNVKP